MGQFWKRVFKRREGRESVIVAAALFLKLVINIIVNIITVDQQNISQFLYI